MKTYFIQILLCMLLGYAIGGINPAYILAKAKGFDIRSTGSGNAGASNAVITMGKKTGIFCALFDIYKGFLAVRLGIQFFPLIKVAGLLAGTCCILGHIFPVLMKFRGGKGLATLGGVVFSYDMTTFFWLLMFEIVLVLIVDYICIVAVSGSMIFTMLLLNQNGFIYALCFAPVVVAVFYRHRENFRRIKYGVEAKFSYLWRKNEEILRLQKNWDMLTEEQKASFEDKAYI